MSDLHLSLIVIGAMIIGAVVFYNWLQERNFRRRLKQAFGEGPEDILLERTETLADGDARVEPQLQEAPARAAPPPLEDTAPPAASAPVSTALPPRVFDERLDYVAEVEAENPISSAAIEELASRLAGCGRPTQLVVRAAGGGAWEEPARGGSYRALQAGLQLVNRGGSASAAQLAMFCDAVRSCAEKSSGTAVCPDAQAALETARDLDAFCARVDVAVGVNVVAAEGASFAGTRIRGLAEAAGFRLEPDGVFHYRNDRRQTLFTLDNHEPAPFLPEQMKHMSTRGITLMLDVPRVADGLEVLERMLGVGRELGAALGGTLVDDNRAGLTAAGIARIRDQLDSIHAAMAARGMPPGGELAQRLFS